MRDPVEPCVVVNSMPGLVSSLLTRFLYKTFIVVHDESDVCPPPRGVAEISRLDPAMLSAMKLFLFRGHFIPQKARLPETYPEVFQSRNFFVSMFLNEPLQRAAVLYLQTIAGPEKREGFPSSFDAFAEGRAGSGTAAMLDCGRWNWRGQLARYDFIGIAERMEESISLFAREVAAHFDRFPQTANTARAKYFMGLFLEQDKMENDVLAGANELAGSLGTDAVRRFRARNKLDYRIYEEALKRFERLSAKSAA